MGYNQDHRVDYWALGILLYYFLAGYLPFNNKNVKKLYESIIHDSIEYPQCILPSARKLIESLTKKDIT